MGQVELDVVGGVEAIVEEDRVSFAIGGACRGPVVDSSLVWFAKSDADDARGRGEGRYALEEADSVVDLSGGKRFEWVERHAGDVPFRDLAGV